MLHDESHRPSKQSIDKGNIDDRLNFMQQISKAKIKLFSSLKLKKYRQKQGMFLLEGRKLVQEAIYSGWKVEGILIREDKLGDFDGASFSPHLVFELTQEQFDQLNQLQQPEGIMAVVHLPMKVEPPQIKGPALLLEEIQDPGNMGTIIRTAAWFGMSNIYCSKGCVDAFNPKTLRASMGGIFKVNITYLENWEEKIGQIKEKVWLAHMEGQPLGDVQLPHDALILIGNEANGVGDLWKNDPSINKISIPGMGKIESLNAAVAGSIICWELFKRRKR